jgi:hypothetical protein
MIARGLLLVFLLAAGLAGEAFAAPARIIILRHGEKQNGYLLCSIGTQRSLALAANYLGSGAANSLFPAGKGPDAFFVITLHTLELGLPAIATWKAPLYMYQVLPGSSGNEANALNEQTAAAAKEVMTNKLWNGKTIVMIWEHHHIADKAIEKNTLRTLLNLDKYKGTTKVPHTWHGGNYDYFWDVSYDTKGKPTSFTMTQMVFPAPYQDVPSNLWDTTWTPPAGSGCEG